MLSCKPGFNRLQEACSQSRNCGIYWLWTDAVCIDKRSSAAVSEAFNNLSRIYQGYTFSLVYLEDFAQGNCTEDSGEGCKTFLRLRDEALRDTADFLLFAWRPEYPKRYRGILAQSPAGFQYCQNDPDGPLPVTRKDHVTAAGVVIRAHLGSQTETGRDVRNSSSCWDNILGSSLESCCIYPATSTSTRGDYSQSTFEANECPCGKSRSEFVDNIERIRRSFWSTTGPRPSSVVHVVPLSIDFSNDRTKAEQSGAIHDSNLQRGIGILGSECFTQGTASAGIMDGIPLPTSTSTSTELDAYQPFVETIPALINALVENFKSQLPQGPTQEFIELWEGQDRKKLRLDCFAICTDIEDSSDPEDSETVVITHKQRSSGVLACPFYLRNKRDNRACLTRYQLCDIEDIREHLSLVHQRPSFCPNCGCTFDTTTDRDSHIRSRTCRTQSINPSVLEGLTIHHIQELARLAELPLSVEEHWYEMWAKIFPDAERPVSCLYFTVEELRICALRDFWIRHRERIVKEYLETKQSQWNYPSYQSTDLDGLHDTVLNGAVDKLLDGDDSL